MGISKLHHKCEKCKYRDYCDKKRMVMCAYIEPAQAVMMPLNTPQITPSVARETITIHMGDIGLGVYRDEVEREIRKQLSIGLKCVF